jgi:hypothetical protein
MAEKRQYVRQRESMHPSAVDFHVFVQQQSSVGKTVTRALAMKWVMSSYKREALIRIGATRIAQAAARTSTRKECLTRSAIEFSKNGGSITEVEAEAFYSVGISTVMHRKCRALATTYVYDKESKVFASVGVSELQKPKRSTGTVKAIFDVLADGPATAAEIASRRGVNVESVRCILSRFFKAGQVVKFGKSANGTSALKWGLASQLTAAVS